MAFTLYELPAKISVQRRPYLITFHERPTKNTVNELSYWNDPLSAYLLEKASMSALIKLLSMSYLPAITLLTY